MNSEYDTDKCCTSALSSSTPKSISIKEWALTYTSTDSESTDKQLEDDGEKMKTVSKSDLSPIQTDFSLPNEKKIEVSKNFHLIKDFKNLNSNESLIQLNGSSSTDSFNSSFSPEDFQLKFGVKVLDAKDNVGHNACAEENFMINQDDCITNQELSCEQLNNNLNESGKTQCTDNDSCVSGYTTAKDMKTWLFETPFNRDGRPINNNFNKNTELDIVSDKKETGFSNSKQDSLEVNIDIVDRPAMLSISQLSEDWEVSSKTELNLMDVSNFVPEHFPISNKNNIVGNNEYNIYNNLPETLLPDNIMNCIENLLEKIENISQDEFLPHSSVTNKGSNVELDSFFLKNSKFSKTIDSENDAKKDIEPIKLKKGDKNKNKSDAIPDLLEFKFSKPIFFDVFSSNEEKKIINSNEKFHLKWENRKENTIANKSKIEIKEIEDIKTNFDPIIQPDIEFLVLPEQSYFNQNKKNILPVDILQQTNTINSSTRKIYYDIDKDNFQVNGDINALLEKSLKIDNSLMGATNSNCLENTDSLYFESHPLKILFSIDQKLANGIIEVMIKVKRDEGATLSQILNFVVRHKIIEPYLQLDRDIMKFLKAAEELNFIKSAQNKYFLLDTKQPSSDLPKKSLRKSNALKRKRKTESEVLPMKKQRLSLRSTKPINENRFTPLGATPKTPKGMIMRKLRSRTVLVKKET